MKAIGITNTGLVRENNEDSFLLVNEPIGIFDNLFVVADGMGGHSFGEVASSYAIENFHQYIKNKQDSSDVIDVLADGLRYANQKVFEKSQEDSKYTGMGTTFTACTIKGNKGYVAHIGDSRCYLCSDGTFNQISTDHTYVNEMVKAGQITKDEAFYHPQKNILTKAMGEITAEVDAYIFEIQKGDIILICSDGLTDMVMEKDIFKIIKEESDLEICAKKLIETANSNGGIDNITVILAVDGR